MLDNFGEIPSELYTTTVIWGAGSLAKKLIRNGEISVPFFVSGLKGEAGRSFLNREINYFENLKNCSTENMLVAVENREHSIIRSIRGHSNVKNFFMPKCTII